MINTKKQKVIDFIKIDWQCMNSISKIYFILYVLQQRFLYEAFNLYYLTQNVRQIISLSFINN